MSIGCQCIQYLRSSGAYHSFLPQRRGEHREKRGGEEASENHTPHTHAPSNLCALCVSAVNKSGEITQVYT